MPTIKLVTFIRTIFDLVTVPRLWDANVVANAPKLVCGALVCARYFIGTILFFVKIISDL